MQVASIARDGMFWTVSVPSVKLGLSLVELHRGFHYSAAVLTGQQGTFPQHRTPHMTQAPWDIPLCTCQVTCFFVGQAETSKHSSRSARPALDLSCDPLGYHLQNGRWLTDPSPEAVGEQVKLNKGFLQSWL